MRTVRARNAISENKIEDDIVNKSLQPLLNNSNNVQSVSIAKHNIPINVWSADKQVEIATTGGGVKGFKTSNGDSVYFRYSGDHKMLDLISGVCTVHFDNLSPGAWNDWHPPLLP